MTNVGYIYILTNQSFKDNCMKIGYSTNVEKRVKELSGTGLPYDYEIYATYEVPASPSADKSLHNLIQLLNPSLRIAKNREFFDINPNVAASLLKDMAIIHNREDKFKLYKDEDVEKDESYKRGEIFSFAKCQIPIGSMITYIDDDSIEAKVIDDRKIEYEGEILYMSTLAKRLLGKSYGVCGPAFFKYNGIPLQNYYMKYQANDK